MGGIARTMCYVLSTAYRYMHYRYVNDLPRVDYVGLFLSFSIWYLYFLKKYHATATRFKTKKSILHKNKNKNFITKKYQENSTVMGWLQTCAFPSRLPVRTGYQTSTQTMQERNLCKLCKWTTIVNSICTGICHSHVIIFVLYCLVCAGRVIVVYQ